MSVRWMVLASLTAVCACAPAKKPLEVAGPTDPVVDSCKAQRGVIETRADTDPGVRMCRLPDGRICEAQAFMTDKSCADPRL